MILVYFLRITLQLDGKTFLSNINLSGIITLCKEKHLKKAPNSIVVTEFGIVTLSKDSHAWKARRPIIETESGIITLCKEKQ